jgi:hypothetical protein
MSPVDPLFKIEMMTDNKFLNFYQEKFELKRAQISPLYFNEKDTDKDLLNKEVLNEKESDRIANILKRKKIDFHYFAMDKIR